LDDKLLCAGKSTTFFDPAVMLGATSPSFVAPHTLYELSNSSGSASNLQTPMSKGMRTFRSRYRSKTPHSGDPSQGMPLEGRNEEVNEVFAFLCPGFVAQFGPLTEFGPSTGKFSFGHGALASPILASNALSPNGRVSLRFDISCRTKACIVQGPGGVGKSSFLKIFCEKVRNIHKSDPGINMVVFHSQTKNSNAQPFNVWKGVIRQVLLQFSQLADPTGVSKSQTALQLDADRDSGMSQREAAGAALKADLVRGLDFVLAQLPQDVQDLRPLISSIHFVYGIKDNAVTSKLSGTRMFLRCPVTVTALLTVCLAACCCLLTTGVAKLLKITELLGALMQQFVAVTQKMLIVAMYV
jgi:hypothetical protein